MMNFVINLSTINVCENTADCSVFLDSKKDIDQLVEFINKNNYTCKVIQSNDLTSGILLQSQIGGNLVPSDSLREQVESFFE